MIRLSEMNGKEIEEFSICGEALYNPKKKFYLQVEIETGHMANITHYYIIGEIDGEEIERWNFHNVDGVTWVKDE